MFADVTVKILNAKPLKGDAKDNCGVFESPICSMILCNKNPCEGPNAALILMVILITFIIIEYGTVQYCTVPYGIVPYR